MCVCVFIPSPVRGGTLLMEVPGTPIGASFFDFELKPTGKDLYLALILECGNLCRLHSAHIVIISSCTLSTFHLWKT